LSAVGYRDSAFHSEINLKRGMRRTMEKLAGAADYAEGKAEAWVRKSGI